MHAVAAANLPYSTGAQGGLGGRTAVKQAVLTGMRKRALGRCCVLSA
ncbi:MAG: hypothetical protein H5T62_10200 [Anaerolineae bacterium]|nr:hypothetical protein [Anaerolineae bacterium]